MSKADGDNLDPFDFDLPDDDVTASEEESDAADESALPEEPGGDDDPFADLEEPPASDDEAEETGSKPGKKRKKEKKPKKEKNPKARKPKKRNPKRESEKRSGLVAGLVWGVCGISCLGLLAVDGMLLFNQESPSIVFIVFLTIFWLMGTAIPFLLWKGGRTNTTYVVILGISLAGILFANLLLLLELAAYGGDIGAKKAQQSMQISPAVQSAPDNASATA